MGMAMTLRGPLQYDYYVPCKYSCRLQIQEDWREGGVTDLEESHSITEVYEVNTVVVKC